MWDSSPGFAAELARWLADNKAFQVQGCRLEFGARVVGALVVGHAIDDDFVGTVERQTGGELIVIGFITAAGFTVALFFATAIWAPGILRRETAMGVLVGLSAIGFAFAAARLLRSGRFAR